MRYQIAHGDSNDRVCIASYALHRCDTDEARQVKAILG